MKSLDSILSKSGHRLTTARKVVFGTLEQADTPIGIAKIHKNNPEINRSSIYRVLSLFDELGIINTVHVGWKKRYELAEPFKPHHHHMICNRCDSIIAIDTPEVEKIITEITREHNFKPQDHHFEIYGLCRDCRITK